MVKSVISAMNACESVLKQQKRAVDHFVLCGASKRGWTAWLAAAMDKRVTAIIPIVADFLNLPKVIDHLFHVYPKGNPAVEPYMPIRAMLGTEPMNKLLSVIDPYQYRHLLTQPKYIISASGDNFLPPDTAQFFFSDLPGKKWMRVLSNTNHYIFSDNPNQVADSIESFYGAFLNNRQLPNITWQHTKGRLTVNCSEPPTSAKLWQASNPESRDFRKTQDNPHVTSFTAKALAFKSQQHLKIGVDLPTPKKGWQASFIEVHYDNKPYQDLVITTSVIITHDRYPASGSAP